MESIDAVASIGELVSWICLVPGIPALLVGWLLRGRDGDAWSPVEIVVVTVDGRTLARWYADGFHERRLTHRERMRLGASGDHVAHVRDRQPSRMRLDEHAPMQRLLLVVGGVLTVAGLIGFVLSLLPLLT